MSWFARKLRGELPRWVDAGVISDAQRASLEALYPAETESRRVVAVLGMIGATIIGVGVLLLIGANWAGIHDWVKIGALVVLLAGTYAGGYLLRVDPGRHPLIGDAVLMLGCLLFLGGIALVSQIFNLNDRPPTGVLVWWLGIAGVSWLTRSKGAQFVSLVAFVVWLAMELDYDGSPLELMRDHRGDLPLWSSATFLVGAAIVGLGLILRRSSFAPFAGMHEGWGMLVLQSGLYIGGFTRHEIGINGWQAARPVAGVVLAGLAVTALSIAFWKNREASKRLAPWLALGAVPAVASLAGWHTGDHGELISLGFWLSLLILDLSLIHVGLRLGRTSWVNPALGFIALNIFTRYWDLFGSMLDGGLFFIVSGLVILGLGFAFEKSRRRFARELKSGGVA